jgi:beta-carotene ketolase (CrtW type)
MPHKPELRPEFTDRHRARSNDYAWWLSLLTCFHFGYHEFAE